MEKSGQDPRLLTVDEAVELMGGWVCEEHPWLDFPHGDCPGPGIPRREAEVN